MSLKIVVFLCWAIFAISGSITVQEVPQSLSNASKVGILPEPAESTPTPNVTTTIAPSPNVTTTTIAPSPNVTTTTIAPSPNVTTTQSPSNITTTEIPSNTTTVKPITTPAPSPNVTTQSPNVTTVAPITTPIPTTPVPPPKDGTWVVNGTNETCIVIKMAAQFNVSYINKDNKTVYKVLTLPTDSGATNVSGDCGHTEQTVMITWHAGNDSLNITFVKNETTKRYSMHHVELNLGAHEFPDSDSNETMTFVHEADQFPTGLSNSYRCLRLQKLDLKRDGVNGTFGNIEISDLQFQAFRSEKTSNFGDAQDCSPDVPDVVPIAVGCALTALVIIILAAYLVGRRRSQARGYLSM